jgi:uncharacterized protein
MKIYMKNKPAVNRWLWRAGLSLLLLVSPASAGAAPPSRETVLRDLAHDVIAAGYQSLAAKCRDLTNAVGQLVADTNQVSLAAAQKAWLAAADAANRMRCFQAGPVADSDAAATFYYWQVLPDNIEAVVNDSSNAIDQSLLDNAGATTKGLSAAEYLLFDRRGGQPTESAPSAKALDLLSASPRRRGYLLAVARDLETKAGQVAKDWTAPGAQGAAAKFAAGGQASINLLVNQLAHAIEDVGQNHLNFVLMLPNPISHQLFRIERSRSGSSLEGTIAYLEGIQTMYRGAGGYGLAEVVKEINAPLAKRIDNQFGVAIAATKAIGEPLKQAAVDNRAAVQKAYDQVHALEILFKVDLASALGVTITFISNDGD